MIGLLVDMESVVKFSGSQWGRGGVLGVAPDGHARVDRDDGEQLVVGRGSSRPRERKA